MPVGNCRRKKKTRNRAPNKAPFLMGVICLTDEMKSKALRLLRAAAGRYDKICEAWYAHAGEELDLQLFLDMAEDDCLTYLGTQELPPVVTATTLAKLAFVHLNCFIQDRDYGVKSTSYTEGSVSMSETYTTPAEQETAIADLLQPYNRYREVRTGESKNA
nr:MAG TPA: tail connector protein [Caudoviricetes sp.]